MSWFVFLTICLALCDAVSERGKLFKQVAPNFKTDIIAIILEVPASTDSMKIKDEGKSIYSPNRLPDLVI